MYIKQKYVFVEQSPMHVRVIPYLVQCMQYNFKNILIYIYKQVHERKAVR